MALDCIKTNNRTAELKHAEPQDTKYNLTLTRHQFKFKFNLILNSDFSVYITS
jgi:hypothetical protein